MFDKGNSKEDFDVHDVKSSTNSEVGLFDEAPDGLVVEWEPICINPESFEIEEVNDLADFTIYGTYGGIIKNIESLKQAIELPQALKSRKIGSFITWTVAIIIVIWTILGLVSFFSTGSTWLLFIDASLTAFFGVIGYYLKKLD